MIPDILFKAANGVNSSVLTVLVVAAAVGPEIAKGEAPWTIVGGVLGLIALFLKLHYADRKDARESRRMAEELKAIRGELGRLRNESKGG